MGFKTTSKNLAPKVGIEPTTNRLTVDRSTAELHWNSLKITGCTFGFI